MNKKFFYIPLVFVLALFFSTDVFAQDFEGNRYYVYAYDLNETALKYFTLTFSDNDTSSSTDNETSGDSDNESLSGGAVSITQAGKIFESSSGTYLANGNIYNGSWEATEKEYSSFYEENVYKYYSFLFFGVTLANNFFTAGSIFSTLTTESDSQGTEVESSIIPFVGTLIEKKTTTHGNFFNMLKK